MIHLHLDVLDTGQGRSRRKQSENSCMRDNRRCRQEEVIRRLGLHVPGTGAPGEGSELAVRAARGEEKKELPRGARRGMLSTSTRQSVKIPRDITIFRGVVITCKNLFNRFIVLILSFE